MAKPVDLGRTNPHCTAHWHGTRSAYHNGCRCPEAREHERITRKRTREGRYQPTMVNAIGTQRRLRALAAVGWTFDGLAERLNMLPSNLRSLARDTAPLRHPRTAAKVAALYRELAGTPGPSLIARKRAAAKGWPTPIAWDNIDDPAEQPDTGPAPADTRPDEVAVQRALAGQARYRRLHPADRVEAYRQLIAAGHGPGAISNRLRINATTVRQLAHLAEQAREVAA